MPRQRRRILPAGELLFGFENEAVALVKIDALTEDQTLLAGFAG